jgi:regulatory protein
MVRDCGTKRAVRSRRDRKPRPPLDPESLSELALRYVGRYATTRSKLRSYLERKIRERGWFAEREPEIDGLVERFAASGYVDDHAYALSKSRSLVARGYGEARVRQSLRAAGIDEEDGTAARELAASEAAEAALRFAKRRRIGPFSPARADPRAREKAIAAMIRAGHNFEIARKIVNFEPGSDVQPDDLRDKEP